MGNILLILSIAFTAQLTAVMARRIRSVAAAELTRRVFRRELVLCAAPVLFAAAVRFDFFSPARSLWVRLAGWCAAAGTAAVLVLAAVIVAGGLGRDNGAAGAVIVPGMALENGKPTRCLLSRLRTAAAYARSHPSCAVIVSGGCATDRSPSEASVMRRFLLAEGIGEERIVTEDRASSTRENFLFAAALTDLGEPVVLVTDVLHMRRALRQAKQAGFRQVVRLPAPPDPVDFVADLMWEVVVEIKYIVSGE